MDNNVSAGILHTIGRLGAEAMNAEAIVAELERLGAQAEALQQTIVDMRERVGTGVFVVVEGEGDDLVVVDSFFDMPDAEGVRDAEPGRRVLVADPRL
jgi:hypothetical protein